MTLVTTQYTGYLDTPYLQEQYLGGANFGTMGLQFLAIIDASKAHGVQALAIIDSSKALGAQALAIIDSSKAEGVQFHAELTTSHAEGLQFLADLGGSKALGAQALAIIDSSKAEGVQFYADLSTTAATGLQFLASIAASKAVGVEFRSDKGIQHIQVCEDSGYLNEPYLEGPYLVATPCASMGVQFELIGEVTSAYGLQFHATINDSHAEGVQALGIIDFAKASGLQFLAALTARDAEGLQALGIIETGLVSGLQSLNIINAIGAAGAQFESVRVNSLGVQFSVAIYNTTNLRILCDYLSRGTDGENWTANSTAPGHFSPNNLNTDIIEEVWRTNGTVSGVVLECDTQVAQGIFMDTLAILNHNLTTSASVVLLASTDDPTFTDPEKVTEFTFLIGQDENFYYIAPEFPTRGYRYWRFLISDVTNTDGFIQIGTIIFGSSLIFQGECFVDDVEFGLQDFADTVRTAAFTNASNSRALRKKLGLEFRFLQFTKSNFRQMRDMFRNERTILKCLWIPTPDPNDQEYTGRFAIFGKMVSIPKETHRSHGRDADYVSFTIEVDDSL